MILKRRKCREGVAFYEYTVPCVAVVAAQPHLSDRAIPVNYVVLDWGASNYYVKASRVEYAFGQFGTERDHP